MFFAVTSGIIACFVSLLFVVALLRDPQIKPHPFTRGVWSLLGGIGVASNLAGGAGIGATSIAVAFVMGLIIFGFALRRHTKETAAVSPWIIVLALIGLTGWMISGNALVAVLCVVVADSLAGFVTLKKIWLNPASEPTWHIWALSASGFAVGLFALQEVSLTTLLYPLYLTFAETSFAVTSFFRTKQLSKRSYLGY